MTTPPAEVEVDAALVGALLASQHPDLEAREIAAFANGWDNVMFRATTALGPVLVRLPRRALAAPLVEHELDHLPGLAAGLPLPVPVPLRGGVPGLGYPWRWSVLPWLEGGPLGLVEGDDPRHGAQLRDFLHALHRPAPPDAPVNPVRGGPPSSRDAAVTERLAAWSGPVRERLASLWRAGVEAPRYAGPPVWLHGDLHGLNVLADGPAITGVIDFGDLGAGDPATDLAVGWLALGPRGRDVLLDGVDAATRARALAWAVAIATAAALGSSDHPPLAAMSRRALKQILGPMSAGADILPG